MDELSWSPLPMPLHLPAWSQTQCTRVIPTLVQLLWPQLWLKLPLQAWRLPTDWRMLPILVKTLSALSPVHRSCQLTSLRLCSQLVLLSSSSLLARPLLAQMERQAQSWLAQPPTHQPFSHKLKCLWTTSVPPTVCQQPPTRSRWLTCSVGWICSRWPEPWPISSPRTQVLPYPLGLSITRTQQPSQQGPFIQLPARSQELLQSSKASRPTLHMPLRFRQSLNLDQSLTLIYLERRWDCSQATQPFSAQTP